jgi:AraC-like DNA-binding protein
MPVHRLELPVAGAMIVLCCGESVALRPALRRGDATCSSAFFAGLQVPAQGVLHSGNNDCVEIRLPPPAAYALLGGAIAEANDRPVNLLELIPEPIGMLLEQLRTTSSWDHRFAAVDRFLAREFAASKRHVPAELTWAWEALEHSHGQMPIRVLARAIGWSERHLIKQFRVYFGVRPKATARRLRFSHAFDLLSTQPSGNLCTIAARAGFSDQSHMTREFQSLCGVTPYVLRTARFDDLPGIPAAVLDT